MDAMTKINIIEILIALVCGIILGLCFNILDEKNRKKALGDYEGGSRQYTQDFTTHDATSTTQDLEIRVDCFENLCDGRLKLNVTATNKRDQLINLAFPTFQFGLPEDAISIVVKSLAAHLGQSISRIRSNTNPRRQSEFRVDWNDRTEILSCDIVTKAINPYHDKLLELCKGGG